MLGATILQPLAKHFRRAKYRKVNAMTTATKKADKARSPKSTEAFVGPMPQAEVSATVAPAAPRPAGAPVYELGDKAPRDCQTKQGAKSGLGKNWHTVAKTGRNTRQQAYDALCALEDQFTEAEALAALKPIVAGTSGTPRSYWAAFVAAGYIQEA